MKKIIVLSLTIICFIGTSCSSDDDGNIPTTAQDPLIGNWQFVKRVENGVEDTTDDCELNSTINFKEDGTTTDTSFYLNSNSECVSEILNATWKKLENNTYEITPEDLENDTPINAEITFSDNTFTAEIKQEEEGEEFIIQSTYKKIN